MRCRSVVDGLRGLGHDVAVLTGRFRKDNDDEDNSSHVQRQLHLTWGPPYPPEDLPGMLFCESQDRLALNHALARSQPDIVDVWGMSFASQPMVAALAKCGVPLHYSIEDEWLLNTCVNDPLCIVTQAAIDMDVEMTPAMRRLCCLGRTWPPLSTATLTFASTALRDGYERAGLVHENFSVRIAGIDTSPFRSACPKRPESPIVILSIGQLTASRGQADLIEAVHRVAAEPPALFNTPIILRIVGEGERDYVQELRHRSEQLASLRYRVEFTGFVPSEQIANVFSDVHLLVHTSRLPEGLPRVLMEAMAAGVPIIATNTGGQRDILDNGRWGTLIAPGNTATLSEAIRIALSDLPKRQTLAAEARRHALEQFDISTYIEGHARDLAAAASIKRTDRREFNADPPAHTEMEAFSESLGKATEVRAATLDPATDPELAWRLGVVLKRTGRLAAAERVFTDLNDAHSDNPTHVRRASLHAAELALLRGDWSSATEHLAACLRVAPDHARCLFDRRCVETRTLLGHLTGLSRMATTTRCSLD